MGKFKRNFYVLVLVLFVTFPVQVKAEAEELYVAGMDIDHLESSNQLAVWIDEAKYMLIELSPFFGGLILPEGSFAEMSGEDLDYDDAEEYGLFD